MRGSIALSSLLLLAGCPASTPPGEDADVGPPDLATAADAAADCSPKCGGLTPHCNATRHCVGCLDDAQCGPGSYCKVVSDAVALCTPGCTKADRCAMGQKCCAGQCVDPQTDARNCGACGMVCAGSHAAASCVAGRCAPGACDPGWGDCDNDPANGCEAN